MYKEFVLRGTPLRYAPPSGHPDDTARLTSVIRITLVVLDLAFWSTMIHAEQSSRSVILLSMNCNAVQVGVTIRISCNLLSYYFSSHFLISFRWFSLNLPAREGSLSFVIGIALGFI